METCRLQIADRRLPIGDLEPKRKLGANLKIADLQSPLCHLQSPSSPGLAPPVRADEIGFFSRTLTGVVHEPPSRAHGLVS